MTQETLNISIPFDLLLAAISKLELEKKRQLWQFLEKEIGQAQGGSIDDDNYDWGIDGQPESKPIEYIPEVGWVVIGGRNEPA